MNYKKKSIRDVSFAGKKVLLRVDFNVPLDKTTHEITNDKRIRAALPTIQYLLDDGAALIVCSHLGKPKKDPDAKTNLTLKRVAVRFAELLGKPVEFAEDTIALTPRRRPPRSSRARSCCLRTPALIPARRRTIPSSPRSSLPWRKCTFPTRSARCTALTPPPPALRTICPRTAASSWRRS